MANAITDFIDAGTLDGDELLEVSKLSTTVAYTAATISALASDNSFNDSAAQFVAEGFDVGDRVNVTGFTGDVANNIFVAVVTALTAGKMTIGGVDGNVIADDAAGESVSIAKWTSRRTTAQEIADLGGGGGGGGGAVGSHRYWKIHDMATSAQSNAVAAAEMRFRSTPGGSNLAVTSSYCTEENGSFPSSNLYDGNLSNLWGVNSAAATAVCSIIFDLGSAVPVEEIMIAARNDSYFYQAPRSFTLSWSDDGQVFREVANFELGTYSGAGAQKLAAVPTTYP